MPPVAEPVLKKSGLKGQPWGNPVYLSAAQCGGPARRVPTRGRLLPLQGCGELPSRAS